MESGGSRGCPGACVAFVRTHKGLVLLGEIVLCVLTLACYGASRSPGYVGVAVSGLVFAAAFLLLYALGVPRRVPGIHWGWSDFLRCLVGSLLFLITSLIVIIGHRDGPGVAAGVFGLLTGILLGYDGYITLPTRQAPPAAPESPEGP
ncbi:proteolipid protein 2 [Eudromia elegans]